MDARGARPYRRSRLVVMPVSSRNTRWATSQVGAAACHATRAAATSGRSPSTGLTRFSALIRAVAPPEPGDRLVHGNATVTADYILRAAEAAQEDDCGLILLHSHPGASHWQPMSGPDRDCEASYANLVREITGLPLVGMTLAARNRTWSARH